VASAERTGPIPAPPPFTAEARASMRRRTMLFGRPEWIVEELQEARESAGAPVEFVARSFFPTLPMDRQIELMEHLAADVMPHL